MLDNAKTIVRVKFFKFGAFYGSLERLRGHKLVHDGYSYYRLPESLTPMMYHMDTPHPIGEIEMPHYLRHHHKPFFIIGGDVSKRRDVLRGIFS
jgi:hypothetical protein